MVLLQVRYICCVHSSSLSLLPNSIHSTQFAFPAVASAAAAAAADDDDYYCEHPCFPACSLFFFFFFPVFSALFCSVGNNVRTARMATRTRMAAAFNPIKNGCPLFTSLAGGDGGGQNGCASRTVRPHLF